MWGFEKTHGFFGRVFYQNPDIYKLQPLRILNNAGSKEKLNKRNLLDLCMQFVSSSNINCNVLLCSYLATGASQLHLAFSFRLGHSTVGVIIKQCCSALWDCLVPMVLQPPTTEVWFQIAKDFNNLWDCRNCVGALDGKHIRIKAPPNSGSEFYNYKGFFSVVLLAVCDAHYRFVLVDIGNSGRHSDGGVFNHSRIGRKFEQGLLNFPPPACLPGSSICMPYYFVADDAFPLKVSLIKPYPGRNLPDDKQLFNFRLSRGRRVVENAFGILAVRWQVFYKTLYCGPEMAVLVVQAAVVLHNFLQTASQSSSPFISGDSLQSNGTLVTGSWRQSLPSSINLTPISNVGSNFHSRSAAFFRDELKMYFCNHRNFPC